MKPAASILITAYDRLRQLKWGLLSLSEQQVPFAYEVIVLNDGLDDGTENLCREFMYRLPFLRYVFTGERNRPDNMIWRVPGFAFNIGAQLAQGTVLVLSCAEMFHLDNTNLRHIVEPILNDPSLITHTQGRDDQDGSFLLALETGNGTYDPALYDNLPLLRTGKPFFMGIARAPFFDIGGYDEDFTGIAFDDNDLIHRLVRYGCRLEEVPGRVVHLYHPRRRYGKDADERYQFNKHLYEERKGQIMRNQGRRWGEMPFKP